MIREDTAYNLKDSYNNLAQQKLKTESLQKSFSYRGTKLSLRCRRT